MIVQKFGGTSMGSAASIKNNVVSIVQKAVKDGQAPVVVVSAMTGVTNDLLAAAKAAVAGDAGAMLQKVNAIHQRHIESLKEMVSDAKILEDALGYVAKEMANLSNFLTAISTIGELSTHSHDVVLAVGEKLSAKMLSAVLCSHGTPAEYVNLERVIPPHLKYTSNQYWDVIEGYFRDRINEVKKGVTPVLTGFFGPTDHGMLEAVGRGYSDFCASLAGAAMKVSEIQIWTDVDGVLSTNPALVKEAFLLEHISFDEMAELAHFGAKVLHPNSVRPALNAKIPIRILNTFNPTCEGTWVTQDEKITDHPLKSIAYKKGVTVILIHSYRMLMAYGFIAKMAEIFARHHVSIDLIATSEVSVSLTVEEKPEMLGTLIEELKTLGEVKAESGKSILSLVGSEMQKKGACLHQAFDTLCENKIPVRMVSIGNSLINVSIVIDDAECDKAVAALHKTLFNS